MKEFVFMFKTRILNKWRLIFQYTHQELLKPLLLLLLQETKTNIMRFNVRIINYLTLSHLLLVILTDSSFSIRAMHSYVNPIVKIKDYTYHDTCI